MTRQSIAGFTGKDHPVDVTDQILGALLFPTEGAKMTTLLAKDAVKTVAQIWLAPGGGLPKHLRRLAIVGHDVVQVMVRGEVYRYGQVAPSPYDFHPSTLRWALKHSRQIAVWSAPYPEFGDDIGNWICDEALAGSPCCTIVETVPARAAEWREFIARLKGPRTEVRFFGPEGVQ
jgi:hypothetical protein